jgi:2-phosphosulfolactate phosphatase
LPANYFKKPAMSDLQVHFLPRDLPVEDLAESTCAVIDVLRATTTMVTALAAGALGVIPCGEISETLAVRESLGADCLCGGERFGNPIAGFDLGNSPGEYTPQKVNRRWIALTTTNGTRAIEHCRSAREVLIASFLNAQAVVDRLRDRSIVHVVCAGTDGEVTLEDVLLAGLLVHELDRDGDWTLNDAARIAQGTWLAMVENALPPDRNADALADRLEQILRKSLGGRNLLDLGYDADLREAAAINRWGIVPEYRAANGRITVNT